MDLLTRIINPIKEPVQRFTKLIYFSHPNVALMLTNPTVFVILPNISINKKTKSASSNFLEIKTEHFPQHT